MARIYIILFLVICIFIVLIPVQIQIYYRRENDKDKIRMQVKILFFTFSRVWSSPLVKIISLLARRKYNQRNIKESIKADKLPEKNWGLIFRRLNIWLPRIVQISSHLIKLASKMLKPIKCKKMKIYSEVGLFDSAQTGIAVGSMWAIYSVMLSQLSKWLTLKPETPQIEIVPDFNASKLFLEYDCIIVFPLGHIIIVLMQTVRFVRVSYHLIKGIRR